MSQIGTNGSFVESGGLTFLSGGSSGINTKALIDAAVSQRTREADLIDVRIAENDLRSTALDTLRSLGSDLQTSLSALRQAFGSSSTDGEIFDARAGTLTSNTTTDASSLINVTVDASAEIGTNSIVARQTALAEINTGDLTLDANVALGLNGSFDLYLEGYTNVSTNIVATDSLQDIADKINTISDQTGVSASILQVTDTEYELVVRGTETGLNMLNIVGAGDNVLQSIGVLDGGGLYKNQAQNDRDASIDFNGITLSRNSNVFNDLVPGIDIEIIGEDLGTTLTLDIGQDTAGVKGAVESFVNAYNTLRDFIIQQNVVNSDGTTPEDVALFNDSLLDGLDRSIQSLFGRNFLGSGGVETLSEIGIEFDGSNKLTIDDVSLDDALINNFDELRALFQSQYTDDNAEFDVLVNDSRTQSLNFALNITHDGSNITSVDVGGDTSLFTVNGASITGAVGTIYEGFTFAYVGTTSTTVNVGVEQGFADLAVNTLEGYVNVASGLIQQERLSIDDQNDSLSDRADRVRERADAFRQSLIEKYASFEAQLARSNAILDQIRAILGTDQDDN